MRGQEERGQQALEYRHVDVRHGRQQLDEQSTEHSARAREREREEEREKGGEAGVSNQSWKRRACDHQRSAPFYLVEGCGIVRLLQLEEVPRQQAAPLARLFSPVEGPH